jgi:hypothetical protein
VKKVSCRGIFPEVVEACRGFEGRKRRRPAVDARGAREARSSQPDVTVTDKVDASVIEAAADPGDRQHRRGLQQHRRRRRDARHPGHNTPGVLDDTTRSRGHC